MAGQSGHNLNIVKSRHGCRLPFESRAGDRDAGAGLVVTYRLSPEELARYGPVTPPDKARAIRMKYRTLVTGRGVAGKIVEKEESEEMESAVEYVADVGAGAEEAAGVVRNETGETRDETAETQNDSAVLDEKDAYLRNDSAELSQNVTESYDIKQHDQAPDTGQEQPRPAGELETAPPTWTVKKTRLDVIREKITKEQYLAWRADGLSEEKILDRIGAPRGWYDVFLKLRREWGIEHVQKVGGAGGIISPARREHKARQEVRKAAPEPPAVRRVTVAEALKLRDELVEDIEGLATASAALKDVGANSDRVTRMLAWYRDQAQRVIERIDAALATAEVEL